MTSTTAARMGRTRSPWTSALLVAVAGAVLNLVLAFVGSSVLGFTFQSPQPPPDGPVAAIPLPMFALATLVPVLVGAAIARALAGRSRRAAGAFVVVGAVLAAASAALPFTLPITQAAAVWMVSTHVVATGTFVLTARRAIG